MRTSKSKLLAILALAATFVLALSCFFITACGGEKFKVEWKVDEVVTVKVDGQDNLPAEWEKDTDIVFTVEVPSGYTVTVKAPSVVTPKDGKYTVKVAKEVTITVTAERNVASVAVTTLPTKLEYYTDDKLDTAGMVVTVSYEVGEPETITTGYTVIHGKATGDDGAALDTSKFKKGDTYFAVSYKGKTSEPVNLKEAVADKFGFTGVDLEVGTDGKPYYVLTGVYGENLREEFKHVGFDFQEQGFYSVAQGGTEGWAYTSYNIVMEDKDLVNGVYTLRVDMSGLATALANASLPSMLFNPHMGFNTPGDNSGNLNVDIEEGFTEGKSITVDGIKYEIHRQPDGEGEQVTTTWGMVGVIVSDANYVPTVNYSKDDIEVATIALEAREDKVVLVVTGTVSNYVADSENEVHLIYFATVNNGGFDGNPVSGWDTTVRTKEVTVTYSNAQEAAGDNPATAEFTLVFDLAELGEATSCWFHYGAASNDLPSDQIVEGKDTVTVGGKTYYLEPQDENKSPALQITTASADAE